MCGETIEERFEKREGEHLKFDRVENKKSNRSDLHAFVLLDELFPGKEKIISGAGSDQIWLSIEDKEIEKLTDDQIVELLRCGVYYDKGEELLAMFV